MSYLWFLPITYPLLLHLYRYKCKSVPSTIFIVSQSLIFYNIAMIIIWYTCLKQDSQWAWYWLIPYSLVFLFSLGEILKYPIPVNPHEITDTSRIKLVSLLQLTGISLGSLLGFIMS